MVQVLSQFSATLSTVVHLELLDGLEDDSEGREDVQWLDFLRQFTTVQTLHVKRGLARDIALALDDLTMEMNAGVLPSLELICLEGEPASSVEKFVAARRRSARKVERAVPTGSTRGPRSGCCSPQALQCAGESTGRMNMHSPSDNGVLQLLYLGLDVALACFFVRPVLIGHASMKYTMPLVLPCLGAVTLFTRISIRGKLGPSLRCEPSATCPNEQASAQR
ncbi:hypothetical protein EDB89DRAFT_2056024 [Lactarius sanguifluus]|nr:hypothetical protein EDB89DRAFT_2056024 [Lactarius sanguifluus]